MYTTRCRFVLLLSLLQLFNPKKTLSEKISDIILLVFLIIPLSLFFIINHFCCGWSQGAMVGSCTIPFLTPIYNFLYKVALMMAFEGIVLGGSIIILALVISLGKKSVRIWKFF